MEDALKIPKKIRVACFDIDVMVRDERETSSDKYYGRFSPTLQRIEIDSGLNNGHLLDVLLHELFHAIWWAYSIHDGDKEERTVGMLGTAMAAVFRDNPDLVAWIAKVRAG